METKHTQGPWEAVGVNVWHKENMGFRVADCRGENVDQACANARLIAAAPDLLEALLAVKKHGYLAGDNAQLVDAAIAKATTSAIP